MLSQERDEILEFWFGDAAASAENARRRAALWFGRENRFDAEIRNRFGSLPARAERAEMQAWRNEGLSAVALILVLDQFPRNLYRGRAAAFEFDPLAREVALDSISRGFDRVVRPLEASFIYLPLEHAEDLGLQEQSVQLFERLARLAKGSWRPVFDSFARYARQHRAVIQRFGRFPHRNAALSRAATEEEIAYLELYGNGFGEPSSKA